MTSFNPTGSAKAAPWLGFTSVALLSCAVLLVLGVVGVTGYFRLSSDAVALRQSLMNEVNGSWHKRLVIHVGHLTTGFVRLCSRCVKLGPEPEAALASIRGAEVGIYNLRDEPVALNAGLILAGADKTMSERGWERAVGVSKEQQLVAIYLPRRAFSIQQLKCCLLLYQHGDLVIASARGNL